MNMSLKTFALRTLVLAAMTGLAWLSGLLWAALLPPADAILVSILAGMLIGATFAGLWVLESAEPAEYVEVDDDKVTTIVTGDSK